MKVALVCPYDLSAPGGVQSQVVGLAGALVGRGEEVVVIAPGREKVALAGVEVHVVGRSLRVPANGSRAAVSLSPAASRRALAVLSAASPDVVHVHEPLVPGPALAAASCWDGPLVATFHRARPGRCYLVWGHLLRRVVRRLSERVAVSEVAAETLRAAVGEVEVEVVANAVDLGRFSAPTRTAPPAPSALFVGRLERRKGLGVLLEAFCGLAGDFGLRVVGDGPEGRGLRRRFGTDERVSFLGARSDEEVAAEMAAADVFCAPSLGGESFGVVLLEAMAAGTCVLASEIAGYRQAAGEAAAYAPVGNVRAWRERLGSLLCDEDERRRLVRAGRALAERRSFGCLADAYVSRYEHARKVCDHPRRRPVVGAGRRADRTLAR